MLSSVPSLPQQIKLKATETVTSQCLEKGKYNFVWGSKIEWIYLVVQIFDWKLIVSAQFFSYKLKLVFLRKMLLQNGDPPFCWVAQRWLPKKDVRNINRILFWTKFIPVRDRSIVCRDWKLMSGAPAIVSRRYWTRWARFASFVEDERLSKQSILMNAIITTPTTTIIIMFLSTNWRWICANKCRWPPGQKI